MFGFSWDLDPRLYLKYEFTDNIWIDVKLNEKSKRYISVSYSYELSRAIGKLEEEALELYMQKPSAKNSSLAFASKTA